MSATAYVDALQVVLAGEHAAVFVYADLGARTSASANPDLYADVTAAYVVHRSRRDRLTALVLDEGAEPRAAAPAYDLPDDLDDADAVAAAAADLESGAARAYAFWVANAPSAARREAVRALTDAAVRTAALGGRVETLPGL